jgi:hypothetical protein
MRRNRASLSVSGIVIAVSLVMAIPGRAGNTGTAVSNTSGFRTEAATLTTGNIAGGVVDSRMSLPAQAASFAGSSSFRVTPPCIGTPQVCDSALAKGTTLTFYVQSFGAPSMGTNSAEDSCTAAIGCRHDPVSEPASMALFGSGLVVIGGVIRRRRRLKLR